MTSRFGSWFVRSLAVAVSLGIGGGSSLVLAEDLTPAEDGIRDNLIAEAQKAHTSGDHAEAKALAQKALAIRATPSLQRLAAHEASETGDFAFAYLTAGKCVLEANRDASLPDKDRILKACTAIVAKVKDRVAYVVVQIADAPRDAHITIGGQELHEAALGSPYVVNPGDVSVEAAAPDYQVFKRDVHVSVTETKQVSITLTLKRKAAPSDQPRPAPDTEPDSTAASRAGSGAAGAAAIQLEGTWRATYQCPLGVAHDELVRVALRGRTISATKLTGDDCVPAGTVSWQGALARAAFSERDLPLTASVRVTVADGRARRSMVAGRLTVADPDRLVVTVGAVAMDFLRDDGASRSAGTPIPPVPPDPAGAGYTAPPSYSVAVFPSVPEVRQRVLSRDPLDMLARHAATFAQLIKVVYVVAGNALGPQEQNLVQAYTLAMRDADQRGEALLARSASAAARRGGAGAVATQWFGLRARYDNDGYREQMLFFFSPDLRRLYQGAQAMSARDARTALLASCLLLSALYASGCGSVRRRSDARPAGGGPSRPFGAHATPYHGGGVIAPNHQLPGALDAATAAYYDQWKHAYLEPACKPGEYRIRSLGATKAYAVSEGHGYAMMALPLMAGHDPEAQRLFDGFYRYYKSHGSSRNRELMAWAQNKTCDNVGGPNSATDADLDIAYGLLLADRQWSSVGDVDYRRAAEDLIKTILEIEVTPANNLLVGNWVTDARNPRYSAARGSDFMPEHFKTFQRATGERRWDQVLTKTYNLIALIQGRDSPASGLVPDFIIDAAGGAPRPAPPRWLEAPTDGQYAWNACRVPWRVATDYLITGDARAQAAIRRMNAWLRKKTTDDPTAIRAVYDLSGEPVNDYTSLAFSAPFLVAAMVEPEQGTNQPWLNALWDMVAATPVKEYYGDSIKLFAMLVASGNWWSP